MFKLFNTICNYFKYLVVLSNLLNGIFFSNTSHAIGCPITIISVGQLVVKHFLLIFQKDYQKCYVLSCYIIVVTYLLLVYFVMISIYFTKYYLWSLFNAYERTFVENPLFNVIIYQG